MDKINFIDYEIFYINSRKRSSGTDSNFAIQIEVPKTIIYDRIALLDCSIPKSYYIVRENSYFILSENGNTVQINVTPGNYTRNSFKIILQTLLNTLSPLGYTYTITFPNVNIEGDDGKYTFNVSNNLYQPVFIINTTLYEQLGFNRNTTYTFVSNKLKSTNVVNFSAEATLCIRSSIVGASANGGNNILQSIYTTQNQEYSYITYTNPDIDKNSKTYNNIGSNLFTFTLTDEDGNEINLNGLNLVFTLILFKSNTTDKNINTYIRYRMEELFSN